MTGHGSQLVLGVGTEHLARTLGPSVPVVSELSTLSVLRLSIRGAGAITAYVLGLLRLLNKTVPGDLDLMSPDTSALHTALTDG